MLDDPHAVQLITWAIDGLAAVGTVLAVVVALWLAQRHERKRLTIATYAAPSMGERWYPNMPASVPTQLSVIVTNTGGRDFSIRTVGLDFGMYSGRFSYVLSNHQSKDYASHRIQTDLPVLLRPTDDARFLFDIHQVSQTPPPTPPTPAALFFRRPRVRALVSLTTGERRWKDFDRSVVRRFANSTHDAISPVLTP